MRPPADCHSIDEVRSEIDRIDRAVVRLLAERRRYVQSIMRFKENEAEVRAPNRQEQVIDLRRRWAEVEGLDPDLIEQIYRTLIDHFVAEEIAVLAKRSEV